ncbi:glycosyltransferase family 4 protein [Agarilytica rhodophyticola]|uniref:glycosyltransferase family 4 protein n=1 Tax=Agarilytica rhodophyticola TaxID=1737490 RepID=UPI001319CA78|nr:glycosyltransferase [Agarilytica rhodophyticola]
MENTPKVLFLATDCNPQWHSLPALVAEYYTALREHADITLATHIRNKPNLQSYLPDGADVVYFDTETIARPLYKLTQFLTGDPNKAMTLQVALSYPGNVYFEYCVWKYFKNDLKAGRFDLVHRASPMSPTIPSPMAKWSPVPFVIGPVLGGLPWPEQFKGEMKREGEWMNYLRKLHTFLPYYKATYRYASAILAGYTHTVSDIPVENSERIIEFSEGGIHLKDFPDRPKNTDKKSTVLFVGRLVPFKQPEVLIRCFERSEILRQHKLTIVGDGPEYERLKVLVKELGLEDVVELTGTLPVDQVREHMYNADIFAFPSIREQGGGVLTMASMSATPCVVVDYGGPSFRVPDDCGIKVPMGDFDEIVSSFIAALESLVNDKDKTRQLGFAAKKFTSKYYNWEWKASKTKDIYEWVLGQRQQKPDFWQDDVSLS